MAVGVAQQNVDESCLEQPAGIDMASRLLVHPLPQVIAVDDHGGAAEPRLVLRVAHMLLDRTEPGSEVLPELPEPFVVGKDHKQWCGVRNVGRLEEGRRNDGGTRKRTAQAIAEQVHDRRTFPGQNDG